MKTLNLFMAVLLAAAFNVTSIGQGVDKSMKNTSSPQTETFKVWGKCDMCKTRIEKTVKANGAASASWDLKTQLLTVTFDPAKTNKDDLSKKLAAVGHDTEKYKAPDDVYAKLPGCCHYERTR